MVTIRPRVLIADDDSAMCEAMRRLVAPRFDIAAIACNGFEAVARYVTGAVDVILLDISMPLLDGIGAARRILAGDGNARVILVSMFDDPALVDQARRLGAAGYVIKTELSRTLLPAIDAALRGKTWFAG